MATPQIKKLLAIIFVFLFPVLVFASSELICDRIEILPNTSLGFSQSERALLCSSETIAAWSDITLSQSWYHLNTFLKNRGYHRASYQVRQNRMVVTLGEITRTSEIRLENAPEHFDLPRLRHLIGQPLTPQFLNSLEERFRTRLQELGYACPEFEIGSDPKTGVVEVRMRPGTPSTVMAIEVDAVEDLSSGAFRRYDAFRLSKSFNGNWVRLTENRTIADKLIQNTHFSASCQGETVRLHQKVTVGPPRQFAFGVGINTERGLSGRASWRHSRLGRSGSWFETAASASSRLQEANASLRYYPWAEASRWYLAPSLSFKRESEKYFERYSGVFQLFPGVKWDTQDFSISISGGPALTAMRAVEGTGPKESNFLSWNLSTRLQSHAHEYFQLSPKSGYQIELLAQFTDREWLAPVTSQYFRLSFETLYNLRQYEPALLIFGLRGAIATTLAAPAELAKLPQNLRHFLGGSLDIRGFGRNQLPNSDGALTSAYLSGEVRLPDLLPWGVQPFFLGDVAKLGTQTLTLDRDWYLSTGMGIRWESPIGAFRSSLARGSVPGKPQDSRAGWQFYVSYGEEF